MIEEPGCTAGSAISPIPARGPEPSQRMSLAIFIRLTAMVRSAPLAATASSSVLCAWKWLVVSRTAMPVASASAADHHAGERVGAIDAGADRRAAQRQLRSSNVAVRAPLDAALDLPA